MTETAIPISHSILEAIDIIKEDPISSDERSVADLALHDGFAVLEEEIKAEIERLKNLPYNNEDIEVYGFKCLAASLCAEKLDWIIRRVRSTESTVREAGTV